MAVKVPGQPDRVYSSNISNEAAEKRLSSNRDIRATAFHEAGHVVANDPKLTGEIPSYVTVRGAGNFAGYARNDKVGNKGSLTRADAIARVGVLLAGNMGQRAMGIEDDTGWANDIERARQLAEKMVSDFGLSEKALRFPVKDGKVITSSPKVQHEIADILEEGQQFARDRIQKNWPLFRLLSNELIQKGHADKSRIAELQKKADSEAYQSRFNRPHQQKSPHLEAMTGGDKSGSKLAECVGGLKKLGTPP